MPDPELGNGWAAPAKKRRKSTDYLFEGLCIACNKNPKALCRYDRGQLNAAVRQLKEKGVVNDLDGKRMIVARGKRWATLYGYKGPLVNPMQLVADWDGCGKIGAVKTVQPGGPSRKEQTAKDKRYHDFCQRAYKWWDGLPNAERATLRNAHSYAATDDQIAIAAYKE